MNRDPVSNTYAVALLTLADARNELDGLQEDVEGLLEIYRTDADFKNFILVPSIDAKEKAQVLDRVLKGKVSDTLLDFVGVVVLKNRQGHLEGILEQFLALLDEKLGRLHAEVVSAIDLSAESEKDLTDALSKKLNKTVLLSSSVDPEILGGLILRFGDLVVDGSVRSQLKKISTRLSGMKLGSELVHEN